MAIWPVGYEPPDLQYDLIPTDLHLFKNHKPSNEFVTHTNVKQAVTSWIEAPDTRFFHSGKYAWMSVWLYAGVICNISYPCVKYTSKLELSVWHKNVHLIFWNFFYTSLFHDLLTT
jgi:hypothetical protein